MPLKGPSLGAKVRDVKQMTPLTRPRSSSNGHKVARVIFSCPRSALGRNSFKIHTLSSFEMSSHISVTGNQRQISDGVGM